MPSDYHIVIGIDGICPVTDFPHSSLTCHSLPCVVGGLLVLAGIITGVIVYYRRSQRNRTRTPGHPSTTHDLPVQVLNQMFILPPVALKSGSEDGAQQSTWDSNDDMYLSTTQDPQDIDCEDSGNQGQGQGDSSSWGAVEFESLSHGGTH